MRYLLYPLILILLLSISYASYLVIEPSFIDTDVYSGRDYFYNITLHNNYSYPIYYIHLSNIDNIDFPEPFNMSLNETISKQIKIHTDEGFSKRTLISQVTFLVKRDISQELGNFTVNITEYGFIPNDISIIEGSIVTFVNRDNITHSVTSTLFDKDISSGSNWTYQFNSIGNYEYYEKYTNINGIINVLDRFQQEFVHNPDYDIYFNITLSSTLLETDILATLFDTNLTVNNNQESEGVIIIKNIGNKTAKNISIKGKWLSFNKNNFDLSSSQISYITFTVHPIIDNINLTGRYYNLSIDITSSNTLNKSLILTIFVPRVESINQTNVCDVWKAKKEFCDAYPTSPYCITEPIIKYINKTIYKSPPLPYNYTQEDIYNMNRNYIKIKDEISRMSNDAKIRENDLKNLKDGIDSLHHNISYMNNQLSMTNKHLERVTKIFIYSIIIITLSLSFIYLYRFFKKQSTRFERLRHDKY